MNKIDQTPIPGFTTTEIKLEKLVEIIRRPRDDFSDRSTPAEDQTDSCLHVLATSSLPGLFRQLGSGINTLQMKLGNGSWRRLGSVFSAETRHDYDVLDEMRMGFVQRYRGQRLPPSINFELSYCPALSGVMQSDRVANFAIATASQLHEFYGRVMMVQHEGSAERASFITRCEMQVLPEMGITTRMRE